MGRKKIEINWDKLDSYLQFKASLRVCALLLEVSEDTIERRIKEEKNCTFSEYQEKMMAPLQMKLVNKAIRMALDGNVTMLIFCLKNICKWTDKVENLHEQAQTIVLNYSLDEDGKLNAKPK
jgi:hypothetical protein